MGVEYQGAGIAGARRTSRLSGLSSVRLFVARPKDASPLLLNTVLWAEEPRNLSKLHRPDYASPSDSRVHLRYMIPQLC